jgi:hypothetical protein
MFTKFSWLGIGLCAAVSLAGTLSYGSSIDFGSCAEIVNPAPPAAAVKCPNQDAGTSQITYSNGGLSVTAWGFKNPVLPGPGNSGTENLYVKISAPGSGETGLGTIIDTADHEITDMDFVNLDFSNLWMQGVSSAMLTVESLQAGEAFSLCQGNVLGTMGVSCMAPQGAGSLIDTIPISWGANNNMFGIQGISTTGVSGPDVLVQGITFNTPLPSPPPVPEPASLLLFGSGIVALAVRKRRRNNKQAV